jgi:hypothetical protein
MAGIMGTDFTEFKFLERTWFEAVLIQHLLDAGKNSETDL